MQIKKRLWELLILDGQANGVLVGDVDGDGIAGIVAGPFIYKAPSEGPFGGLWIQSEVAPGFRDMCKAAMLDITGNGKLDVIIAESEYPDCRVSWFENRMAEDPENPWIEHSLDAPYDFIHSIDAWHGPNGEAKIYISEMEKGGWNNPYNYDARHVVFTSTDGGSTWAREEVYKGLGGWEAIVRDIDSDGEMEVISPGGVVDGSKGIHIWKRREEPSFPVRYRHKFVDRTKGWTGTDILAVDVDGDGRQDIVCAAWWYKSPTWERYQIPDIYQIINAYDIDGDGRIELIGTKKRPGDYDNWYTGLTAEMWWLKPIDPVNGEWEEHYIGTSSSGPGDRGHQWPHGSCIAPVLPGGRAALFARSTGPLELYEVPDEPTQSWPKCTFPEGEGCSPSMIPCDMTGNGLLDLVGEWKWLQNLGDGKFEPHEIIPRFDRETEEGFRGGEFTLGDINGDGHMDIIACEEHTNWGATPRHVSFARVAWFENPGDPEQAPWEMHVIDWIRSPHSLAVADLDGDGELEIVAGEHDPFRPQRTRCRIYVYKKADPQGRSWTRHIVDDRFSSHVGTRLIDLGEGRTWIISHSWWPPESAYVHLWEPF